MYHVYTFFYYYYYSIYIIRNIVWRGGDLEGAKRLVRDRIIVKL